MKTEERVCFYCGTPIACHFLEKGDVGKELEVHGRTTKVKDGEVGWTWAECPKCKSYLSHREVRDRMHGKVSAYQVDLSHMLTLKHYLFALYSECDEAKKIIDRLTREV